MTRPTGPKKKIKMVRISQTHTEKPIIIDSNNEPMTYPEGIKAIKRELNLTYADFADLVGVKHRTIMSWLYDGVKPSTTSLLLIDRILQDYQTDRKEGDHDNRGFSR